VTPNELIDDLLNFIPSVGNHEAGSGELCAMEYVAFLAGEEHSDFPKCACPVISLYVQTLNDRMNEDWRYQLRGYLLRLIGNRDPKSETERADYLVFQVGHVYAPMLLRSLKSKAFDVLAERLERSRTLQEQVAIYPRAAQLAWIVPDYIQYATRRFLAEAGALAHSRIRETAASAEGAQNPLTHQIFRNMIASRVGRDEDKAVLQIGPIANTMATFYATYLISDALRCARSRTDWQAIIDTLDGVLAIGKQAEEAPNHLEDRIHSVNELVSA